MKRCCVVCGCTDLVRLKSEPDNYVCTNCGLVIRTFDKEK